MADAPRPAKAGSARAPVVPSVLPRPGRSSLRRACAARPVPERRPFLGEPFTYPEETADGSQARARIAILRGGVAGPGRPPAQFRGRRIEESMRQPDASLR